MADGDLVVANYQYEFNNFLFGALTGYPTTKVEGLLSLPPTQANDTERTLEHGSVPGMLRLQKRLVNIDLHILNTPVTGIEAALRTVRKAFQGPPLFNPREVRPFVFQRPGEVKQRLMARCERRDFDSTYDLAKGHASGSVQLVAHDPVIYSNALYTASHSLGIGVSSGPTVQVTMAGDHPDGVNLTMKITGPCRNPYVYRLSGVSPLFRIDTDIQATEYLLVDTAARTANVYLIADNTWLRDVFGSIRLDTEWFTLTPGTYNLQYFRSAAALTGASSTFTATWRDGWT